MSKSISLSQHHSLASVAQTKRRDQRSDVRLNSTGEIAKHIFESFKLNFEVHKKEEDFDQAFSFIEFFAWFHKIFNWVAERVSFESSENAFGNKVPKAKRKEIQQEKKRCIIAKAMKEFQEKQYNSEKDKKMYSRAFLLLLGKLPLAEQIELAKRDKRLGELSGPEREAYSQTAVTYLEFYLCI